MSPGKINCMKCEHFVITWNPQFPRACRLYGFKTMSLPSAEVLKASGEECKGFAQKRKPQKR